MNYNVLMGMLNLAYSLTHSLADCTSFSWYQNVSILDFMGAKDDGSGGDNWSHKTLKAPVILSPPTNRHPVSDVVAAWTNYFQCFLTLSMLLPVLCHFLLFCAFHLMLVKVSFIST